MSKYYLHQPSLRFTESIKRLSQITGCMLLLLSSYSLFGQAHDSRIAKEIAANDAIFQTLQATSPLIQLNERSAQTDLANEVAPGATFYSMHSAYLAYVLQYAPEYLLMELPFTGGTTIKLKLKRSEIFSSSFQIFTASDPKTPYPYERGKYYWGVVEGKESSLVALSFTRGEIMGFIQIGDINYTLGKLENDPDQTHILYKTDDIKAEPGVNCFVDDSFYEGMNDNHHGGQSRTADNCVRMYIVVDYDIFVQKGGVQQAADYVNGAFSQVSIMYDNETINLVVNEMLVWNVVDPFTGPTTSNYLSQFLNYMNGNYNGDLAHLVGYNGGGGIAYLDVLCNSVYGVGYSGINSTYNNVPTYSWTVEVLTHEIGHNLGSQHTHACAWNGNNTAIDGCGPAAGYSEGCNAPLPVSGTVMSYCHLIGGVGINFNNGFGPQPGDRIRNRVYNSSCLTTCGPPVQFDAGITAITAPISFPCANSTAPVVTLQNFGATTLTSVTINYQLDNGAIQAYAWTGTLTQNTTTSVTLPVISYGVGPHTYKAYTSNPNSQTDEVPSNDQSLKSFTYYVDWCVCNTTTASLTPNPLNHTGAGSHSSAVSFAPGSKRPEFTISNLNAKTNGPSHSRFIDVVTVTYVDGNSITRTYGTFSGANQSSVFVNISDFVNSITVTLSNGLGNNGYTGTLSVSFSTVNYCAPGGCPDADSDGVCDVDDICPGFDDDLIGTPCDDGDSCTENDEYTTSCICEGTPIIGCPGGCTEVTSNFSPNPLNHTGPGQSTSNVTLPANNTDPTFVISGLSSRISGNPTGRYIEQVTVNYVNGGGNTVQYGVFRGDQFSSVNVSIVGAVQSISLVLNDAYDGNSSTQLSVSMTAVTSCSGGGGLIGPSNGDLSDSVTLYPNPTAGDLFFKWNNAPANSTIRFYNSLGELLGTSTFSEVNVGRVSLSSLGISGSQLLFVAIQGDGQDYGMKRVMLKN